MSQGIKLNEKKLHVVTTLSFHSMNLSFVWYGDYILHVKTESTNPINTQQRRLFSFTNME